MARQDPIAFTDEGLNSYGFRVLNSGIDTRSRFQKNPVMFYDHNRWELPIGKWEDLKTNGSAMEAVPNFDSEDEAAAKVEGKYERGFLNAASMSIYVVETSTDPSVMLPGQTRPTVTKCILREISLVGIPANGNAVRLFDETGEEIDLSDPGKLEVALSASNPNQMKDKNKDTKTVLDKLQEIAKEMELAAGEGINPPSTPAAEEPGETPPDAPTVKSLQDEIKGLSQQFADLKKKLDEKDQALSDKDQQITNLQGVIRKAQEEIKALGEKPAATPTPEGSARDQGGRQDTETLTAADQEARKRWDAHQNRLKERA